MVFHEDLQTLLIPNLKPFCQTRASGLESHQTRVSGGVCVGEDGDRVQVKLRIIVSDFKQ